MLNYSPLKKKVKKVCVSLPTVSSACWEDIYGGEAETECEPHQVRFQGRVQGWARVQRRGEQGAGAKEAAHSHSHLPEAHVQQTVPGGDRFLRRETAGEIPSRSLLASSLSQSAAIALDESLQEQAPFLSESAFCGHTVSFGSSSFTKEKQVSFQEGQCRLAPWSAVQAEPDAPRPSTQVRQATELGQSEYFSRGQNTQETALCSKEKASGASSQAL